MTMLKATEGLAETDKSREDAAAKAVTRAGKTALGLNSIYVDNRDATVEDCRTEKYRINAKTSFQLEP